MARPRALLAVALLAVIALALVALAARGRAEKAPKGTFAARPAVVAEDYFEPLRASAGATRQRGGRRRVTFGPMVRVREFRG